MIPELILHDREQLRKSLRWLLKSHIKDIILFCDKRDLTAIMNEVQHLNIHNQEEPNEIEENIYVCRYCAYILIGSGHPLVWYILRNIHLSVGEEC